MLKYCFTIVITLLVPLLNGSGRVLFNDSCAMNDKEKVIVKRVDFGRERPSMDEVERLLDLSNLKEYNIDKVNWSESYPYSPEVKFKIAYSKNDIYIQYFVKESYIRAFYDKDEDAKPYKDSCVEFFIIPADDGIYYNLEMNCIGFGTFAGGANRTERDRFGPEVTSKIGRKSSLGTKAIEAKEGDFEWKLTIALPIELFSLSHVENLSGRAVKANFYKCGDELERAHYLSWSPVLTPKPNFHTPQFFGDIFFE